MADYRSRLLPEEMKVFDSSTLTGVYKPLDTPISNPSRMLIFVNDSTGKCYISWDGVKTAFPLLPGATVVLDESSNSVANAALVTSAQTQFWVKGTATVGEISVSTFYAS